MSNYSLKSYENHIKSAKELRRKCDIFDNTTLNQIDNRHLELLKYELDFLITNFKHKGFLLAPIAFGGVSSSLPDNFKQNKTFR